MVDPTKNALNIAKHGRSLVDAAAFELPTAQVQIYERFNYGETRFRAFGRVEGQGHCLVFTWKPGEIQVTSYRRAHEKKMRRYE